MAVDVERLYAETSGKLAGYSRRRFNSSAEDADDVAGETFARFLAKQDTFDLERTNGNPNPLLYRIAHNLQVDQLRRSRNVSFISTDENPSIEPPAPSSGIDPETKVDIQSSLAKVHPRSRQAIALRFFEGLSVAETAQAMGTTKHAVKALEHRGLRAMRQLLTR